MNDLPELLKVKLNGTFCIETDEGLWPVQVQDLPAYQLDDVHEGVGNRRFLTKLSTDELHMFVDPINNDPVWVIIEPYAYRYYDDVSVVPWQEQ